MKKYLAFILIVCMLMTCIVGCSKPEKLTEGKDNDKLVGCWIVVNASESFAVPYVTMYCEFNSDGTMVLCDNVKYTESDNANTQSYEKLPVELMFKSFYIEQGDDIERMEQFSYTDGHGLEYLKSRNDVRTFTEEEGWHFEFINENKFNLTTETSEYHGYRLKVPLLNN